MPTEAISEAESLAQYHDIHARANTGSPREFHERAARFCRAQAELTQERDHLRELVGRLRDQIDELHHRVEEGREP